MTMVFGIISPHPPIIVPAIGGDEVKRVQNTIAALELAAEKLAKAQPQKLIIIAPHEQHGFEVPMYYLGKDLPEETEIEEILVTEPSYQHYFDFGKEAGAKIARDQKRVAIVASGDLSHVLKPEGPYGFNPAGPVLDEAIVRAVRENDAQALLNIDPKTLEEGAECGLRSILFLMGALEGTRFRPEVLSYEGPFGVGYMVTVYEAKREENQGHDNH